MARPNRKKVSVFICGTQKGGTTSLHAYLAGHPALSEPIRKELHFFDDESLDWADPDYDRLHDQFTGKGSDLLRFDATPIYMFWPEAMERLAAYNPGAKLIFLFRDPLERAYSHWAMEWARGSENLPFHKAIREGRDRLQGMPSNAAELRTFSYLERGLYGAQVTRALALFPREQMVFLRSEDLKRKHVEVLASIATFLGIEAFPETGVNAKNKRREARYPDEPTEADRRYIARFVEKDLLLFEKLTGLDTSAWPSRLADGAQNRTRHW